MPSSSIVFRAICGNFYWTFQHFMWKRARAKMSMRYRVVCVSGKVAVVLVFLVTFLLQCGDVETNPGPPPTASDRRLRQGSLTSHCQQNSPSPGGKESTTAASIDDVIKMLTSMDKRIEEKIENLQVTMQEHMTKIRNDVAGVMKENKELKERVDKLENKVDDLEGRSRRNNLIFHGVPAPQGKTELWSDCEEAVRTVLKDQMGMTEEVEIERAHRLHGGGGSPRPIIACFSRFKDKERVLANRKVLRERNSKVFVNEDFTPRVRERRRALLPFLKKAKADQKRAFLRFDTLVIEGRAHTLDTATGQLVARQGRS